MFFVVVNLSNILYTIKDSYSTEQLVTIYIYSYIQLHNVTCVIEK